MTTTDAAPAAPPSPGHADIERAAALLASTLPAGLHHLARLAYTLRWSWLRDGEQLFAAIDGRRWDALDHNPVALLRTARPDRLAAVADDPDHGARAAAAAAAVEAELAAPLAPGAGTVAFLCAEYGVHRSLPIYSGGLGVLAGDVLKEASDRRLDLVGVGLLYRQGYFHQYLNRAGRQNEYWTDLDTDLLPGALVSGADGVPLTVTVPLRGRDVVVQVWRVEVGRVPLFLLDADRQENPPVDRWITSRLYIGDRETRLAQYALLGIGGIRVVEALGIDPAVVHLNEGHATLAPLELARRSVEGGDDVERAIARARARTVFTTHTPVQAGNEVIGGGELADLVPDLVERLGADTLTGVGRARAEVDGADFGLTPAGIRLSRSANAVSRRHGQVARAMWRPLFEGVGDDAGVPVGHVTNGVHAPTWMAPPMVELLDRHLPRGWREGDAGEAAWDGLDAIDGAALWEVRCRLRARLVARLRRRGTSERLRRGEPIAAAELATRAFDPDSLTIGFARRIATYKRLQLLVHDVGRSLALLGGDRALQVVVAGKAHPMDEEAKDLLQHVFGIGTDPALAARVAFVEDYDLAIARDLVAGCDVWLNLPRPPLEASGTSGMKAALNGGIPLSVLDGWWEEAYDGGNGWGIASPVDASPEEQDAADGAELLRIVEEEVLPLFGERDGGGVPRRWVERVRSTIATAGRRFTTTRMLADYARDVWAGAVTDWDSLDAHRRTPLV